MKTTTPATKTGQRHCKFCKRDRLHTIHADGSTFCMRCGTRDERKGWRPTW